MPSGRRTNIASWMVVPRFSNTTWRNPAGAVSGASKPASVATMRSGAACAAAKVATTSTVSRKRKDGLRMAGPPFAAHPTPACAARGSSGNLASMDRNRKLLWADALAYPAQGPALLTLAVLSLLRLLGYVPAWGWLLDLLLWVAMY